MQLTETGSIIVTKFTKLFERLDSKIPKFSEWQEEQRIEKEARALKDQNTQANANVNSRHAGLLRKNLYSPRGD